MLNLSRKIFATFLLLLAFSDQANADEAETEIVNECAASANDPSDFVSCVGNRLTAEEISKCFSAKCFGPNNEIVKFLSWFDQLSSCSGLQSQSLGKKIVVMNNISEDVVYAVKPPDGEAAVDTLKPGYKQTWNLPACSDKVEVWIGNEQKTYWPGSVVEFIYKGGKVDQRSLTE